MSTPTSFEHWWHQLSTALQAEAREEKLREMHARRKRAIEAAEE